ncbi:Forkhead domain-containing protein [Hamiltosporidium magnivora]|uniref:Forkhead domain-containing protein n=1 Tax=Hamiltosporidium magnivora TaxID=148818 RepID=A0A4Q9LNG1_9MICR|nr:Forkhead domain-containing protein [Hamiltosporidium magnivora]
MYFIGNDRVGFYYPFDYSTTGPMIVDYNDINFKNVKSFSSNQTNEVKVEKPGHLNHDNYTNNGKSFENCDENKIENRNIFFKRKLNLSNTNFQMNEKNMEIRNILNSEKCTNQLIKETQTPRFKLFQNYFSNELSSSMVQDIRNQQSNNYFEKDIFKNDSTLQFYSKERGKPIACINPKVIADETEVESKINSEKPPYSYAQLITMALKKGGKPQLTLNEIYTWIVNNYEYFKNADGVWKNSIRHNLSLNKCFVKIARSKGSPGKGGYWALDPNIVSDNDEPRKKKPKKITDSPIFNTDSMNGSHSYSFINLNSINKDEIHDFYKRFDSIYSKGGGLSHRKIDSSNRRYDYLDQANNFLNVNNLGTNK